MNTIFKKLQEGLKFDTLISQLRTKFTTVTDTPTSNSSFSLSDILMCGYAMFSLKYSSLLQFETQMDIERQNLQQLYGIEKVCTDSQFRKILNKCDPDELRKFVTVIFSGIYSSIHCRFV